ncbi:Transcription initiation factor TFIID subunit 9 [Balamuthia mandrillaris]
MPRRKASLDASASSSSPSALGVSSSSSEIKKSHKKKTTTTAHSQSPDSVIKSKKMPREAKILALILKSMGVDKYEPLVLNQFLEFMHRYVSDVLQDSLVYSEHANKRELDLDDVRLAIQSRVNSSFTQPPPREFQAELAQCKNRTPLALSLPPQSSTLRPAPTLLPRQAYAAMEAARAAASSSSFTSSFSSFSISSSSSTSVQRSSSSLSSSSSSSSLPIVPTTSRSSMG